jgi:predicted DNA-binding transcriptional regulator AlpA
MGVFAHLPAATLFYGVRVMTKYLDMHELGELFGRSPETIRKNMRSNPRDVPSRMQIPRMGMLRWRKADVEVWLEEQQALPRRL